MYAFVHQTGQGCYDPWRFIFYQVVVIKERSILGTQSINEALLPERYYLHAVSTNTGKAAYEYQMRLVGGILYGMQYDIDSTRIVGLWAPATTGRMRSDVLWKYYLCTIVVNTTNEFMPQMQQTNAPIDVTEGTFDHDEPPSGEFFAYSGASAIISKAVDVYIFGQAQFATQKRAMKDRIYVVRIPDGYILEQQALDFKAVQIFSNEMHGDVSAIGPRLDTSLGGARGFQNYVYLCRVVRSDIEDATIVDWRYNPINPPRLASVNDVGHFHLYPGVAVSEHLQNLSGIAHRIYPEGRPDLAAFTVTAVGIRLPGSFQNWCNETQSGDSSQSQKCMGTINYDIPYAAIYNREPGIPLSLKAPSFLDARFNMDGTAITVNFDRSTLQGARQIDTNGDFIPDELDEEFLRTKPFDCGELFTTETIWLVGKHPGTECLWNTNSQLRINIGVLNISLRDSIYILPNVLYTVPVSGQFSPAAQGGIPVDLPEQIGRAHV